MENPSNIPVIVKHLITLSHYGNVSKELNLVSFFGRTPHFSLHTWRIVGGQKIAGKGLTLSDGEMNALREGFAEQYENCHSAIRMPDTKSNSIENDRNMEAIPAERTDLMPMRMVWNNEEQAYDCIPIRE